MFHVKHRAEGVALENQNRSDVPRETLPMKFTGTGGFRSQLQQPLGILIQDQLPLGIRGIGKSHCAQVPPVLRGVAVVLDRPQGRGW